MQTTDAAPIRYAVIRCHLGHLLVAATPRGVRAVTFGASPEALEEALRHDFPGAPLERDDGDELRSLCERVAAHAADGRSAADVPIDPRGTDFQRRVWDELRSIPAGETRTYREVAAACGRPEAVRAVARACATNRVGLLIPCHRVVRTDGGLAGYRWGVDRKRALLEGEAALAGAAPAEPLAA